MSEIREELVGITGLKQKKNESDDVFNVRLAKAVKGIPDNKWEELSTDAQKWANEAAEAIDEDEDLPEFPDEEEDGAEEAEEPEEEEEEEEEAPVKARGRGRGRRAAEEEEEEEEAPRRRGAAKKGAPAKKAASKAPAKKAAGKGNGAASRGSGVRQKVKELVVKNPSLTVNDLVKKLEKSGLRLDQDFMRSTVQTTRHDTIDTLRACQRAGVHDFGLEA